MFPNYLMMAFVSYVSISHEEMQGMENDIGTLLLELLNHLGKESLDLKLEIYWNISRLIFLFP